MLPDSVLCGNKSGIKCFIEYRVSTQFDIRNFTYISMVILNMVIYIVSGQNKNKKKNLHEEKVMEVFIVKNLQN